MLALDEFTSQFSPAKTLSEADETISTSNIADFLIDFIAEDDIDNSKIVEIMKAKGFRFVFQDGFVWLLNYKQN